MCADCSLPWLQTRRIWSRSCPTSGSRRTRNISCNTVATKRSWLRVRGHDVGPATECAHAVRVRPPDPALRRRFKTRGRSDRVRARRRIARSRELSTQVAARSLGNWAAWDGPRALGLPTRRHRVSPPDQSGEQRHRPGLSHEPCRRWARAPSQSPTASDGAACSAGPRRTPLGGMVPPNAYSIHDPPIILRPTSGRLNSLLPPPVARDNAAMIEPLKRKRR